jgi:hypothetical protein
MTDETRNSGTKPDGRFKPGNPGKPRGVRHRATQLAEKLAVGDLKEIVEKVVALAKEGDSAAYTTLLNCLCPAPKGRLVAFHLPPSTAPPMPRTRWGSKASCRSGSSATPFA